ncbi:unannotated protein [freshwater metagenome]|uniref:Unannotated protein n=1 Tax=freshwater metagenome TaxID=449393 RepID=A0A6J6PKN4_9ZZZZ
MTTRTIWEEGRTAGRELVVLAVAVTLTLVVLDVAVSGAVGWFFDVTFVLLCIALALAVAPRDFFTIGVVPPLLMVGVFVILGSSRPDTIAHAEDGVVQAVVSGLSAHSLGLVLGYVLCLAVLAVRDRVARSRSTGAVTRSGPGRRRPDAAPPAPRSTSRRPSSAPPGSPLPR